MGGASSSFSTDVSAAAAAVLPTSADCSSPGSQAQTVSLLWFGEEEENGHSWKTSELRQRATFEGFILIVFLQSSEKK